MLKILLKFALFEIFDQSDNFIAGFTTNIFSYAYVAYNFNSYWIKSIIWTIDFGRVFSRDSIDFHNVIRMISTKNRCHELTQWTVLNLGHSLLYS